MGREPALPDVILECPECDARDGRRVELLCFTLASNCPVCFAKFRCRRSEQFCDVCSTRFYAIKWRGLFWCVTCIMSMRE